MLRKSLLLALAAAALVGCGPRRDGGGGGLTYVPPAAVPPATGATFVPAPPGVVLDRLVERLPEAGLSVDRVDRDRGLVVARYGGDPEPYVDCGWIVAPGNGRADGSRERLAAQQRARFERAFDGEPALYERALRLDGRVVVTVTPTAGGSLIDATANYVLTKSIDVVGPGGGVLARNSDTVSFSTGGGAEFEAGTICQPTGRLERVVLEDAMPTVVEPTEAVASPPPALAGRVREVLASFACPDVEVTFGADGGVLVAGYVADAFTQAEMPRQLQRVPGIGPVQARLAVHSPEFCQAIEIAAAPRRDGGGAERLALRVVTPDGTDVLRENEPLVLDIAVPVPDAYVVLDRIEPDGRVVHLAAARATELGAEPGETVLRYATTDSGAEPPFGREMILVVATDRPVFREPRPAAVEPADAYLPELRRRVEALRAEGAPVAAGYTVVRTRGGRP